MYNHTTHTKLPAYHSTVVTIPTVTLYNVTQKHFIQGNNWHSQKQLTLTETLETHGNTWYSRKHLTLTETLDTHGNTWYSRKQLTLTETLDTHGNTWHSRKHLILTERHYADGKIPYTRKDSTHHTLTCYIKLLFPECIIILFSSHHCDWY